MRYPQRRSLLPSATLALCGCLLTTGCGADSSKPPVNPTVKPTVALRFDPSAFGNPARGANRWDPIRPGRQSVREGRVNIGHRRLTHRRVYTVTDVTKQIDGMRAVAVIDQDFNGGQLSQQAIDYLAEDRRGNVWYVGSYTEAYEGGRFVNATDGWLAGLKGARPGIMMPAHPKNGETFYERQALGRPGDSAQVVHTGQSKCVPLRCYRDVVVIGEGAGSDQPEYKYYAPGVGGILTEPRYRGGQQETELLLNATQLSPRGLAELSQEVLRIDVHARHVAPDLFGRSAAAKRGI